jgi:tRNA A-37 threonylcarbamoyl transferase component Bud32
VTEHTTVELTITQAFAQERELKAPFQLLLPANKVLQVEAILRILPGKRMVLKAIDAGKIVLAKIFLHQHNLAQEIDGYQLLEKAHIKTPRLLAEITQDKSGYCFYEYIEGACALDELWDTASQPEKEHILLQLLNALKKMFGANICQTDLHLGNFVIARNVFFTLDPASCTRLIDDNQIQKNLALLLAQFSLQDVGLASAAIKNAFPVIDEAELNKNANQLREKRKNDYLKKIFRNCSEIAELKKENINILCRRDLLTEKMKTMLFEPDSAINDGKTIKQGRTTTVAITNLDGKKYVIKRYHNDNTLTALRRRIGKNRAANNWYFAHLLLVLGIKTPKPVALVKTSNSLLDYRSYYISEYIEADNIFNVFTRRPPTGAQLAAIGETFARWKQAGIEHGDCKTANWIVRGDEVMIVDLDAMREIRKPGNNDRARFLRDWKPQPGLFSLFDQLLTDRNKK